MDANACSLSRLGLAGRPDDVCRYPGYAYVLAEIDGGLGELVGEGGGLGGV
jgi:hypothetical protein